MKNFFSSFSFSFFFFPSSSSSSSVGLRNMTNNLGGQLCGREREREVSLRSWAEDCLSYTIQKGEKRGRERERDLPLWCQEWKPKERMEKKGREYQIYYGLALLGLLILFERLFFSMKKKHNIWGKKLMRAPTLSSLSCRRLTMAEEKPLSSSSGRGKGGGEGIR